MEKQTVKTNFNYLSDGFVSDFLYYFRKSKKNGNNSAGEKISLAIAFANLLLDDPSDVTDHHKKMLRKEFSANEIEELILLIRDRLAD